MSRNLIHSSNSSIMFSNVSNTYLSAMSCNIYINPKGQGHKKYTAPCFLSFGCRKPQEELEEYENCRRLRICKDYQYLHLVICKHQGSIRMFESWFCAWSATTITSTDETWYVAHAKNKKKKHPNNLMDLFDGLKLATNVSLHYDIQLDMLQEQTLWGGLP